jgi:hypothetical protein
VDLRVRLAGALVDDRALDAEDLFQARPDTVIA